MLNQFLISVVIPVYNTEKYLEETILCVINQTINFEKNIQIILVNDGSEDGSEEICKKYSLLYDKNIKYILLECNCGVSAARNIGKNMADGKYITFLDSDDLWSLNAFEKAIDFFDLHYNEIDFVSSNIKLFEAVENEHILNIPLSESKIIDMYANYSFIRTNCAACIFKREVVRQILFDEKQKYWEDAKFINQILLDKKQFGMIDGIMYYYRKRYDGNSATQTYGQNIEHYVSDLQPFFNDIYKKSLLSCGKFPAMLQVLFAYVLAYRFAENIPIPESDYKNYRNNLAKILSHVEDKYLCESKNAKKHIKIAMLSCKHGYDIRNKIYLSDNGFYFNTSRVFGIEENIISIWHINRNNTIIQIEGKISFDMGNEFEIVIIDEVENEYPCYIMNWLGETKLKSFDDNMWNLKGYVAFIKNTKTKKFRFVLKMNGQSRTIPCCIFSKTSGKFISVNNEYIFDNTSL